MELPDLPTVPSRGDPCRTARCTACCHDTEMLLSDEDVARLQAAGADGAGWFQAEDGYIQLRVRDAPPVAGMRGRPCWFLGQDGACTVYDVRPEGCRLYPAVYDGAVVPDDEHCPQTAAFAVDTPTQAAVRSLVARLNRQRDLRVSKRS